MSSSKLTVIKPCDGETKDNKRLNEVLDYALDGMEYRLLCTKEETERYFESLSGGEPAPEDRRVLFAVPIGEYGLNQEYYRLLSFFREHESALDKFTGGLIVDGNSELFTKSVAKELVFTANCAGCSFVGKPLVEGTKSLDNFTIVARNMETDKMTAYKESARLMVRAVADSAFSGVTAPRLLVLHASSHETSNTFAIWNRVKAGLTDFEIKEIGLRNGTLSDCSGCPYKMCLHFGEKGSCFYGGVMAEDVYPAVKWADAVLMLCPNYNDSISANLTAFINRLTALFRTMPFYDKALFAIVVSGYSGSDIVAEQLISALNMNKTFFLPGRFAMMETANDAGAAMKLPGIESRIKNFTKNIISVLKKEEL